MDGGMEGKGVDTVTDTAWRILSKDCKSIGIHILSSDTKFMSSF